MTEDQRLSKVDILIKQQKFVEAEKIIADLLREDPNNVHFLSLMADVNLKQNKFDQAHTLIDSAIGLAPDVPYLFYLKALIALEQGQLKGSEQNITQAISLAPHHAEYFAVLAHIQLKNKAYKIALETSNQALAIDAENLLALNTRSTALTKLNRSEESFKTMEGALREDPNNAFTHANYGWNLLEEGKHEKSLEHFKQALTIDPTYEYAQTGLLEAIKAKNFVYRLFLKYAFWAENLPEKYQIGIGIGYYLFVRLLIRLTAENQALKPYLLPILVIAGLIGFSTWIIKPVSNLFLQFNKYGRLLLDKKEKISANFVAISLGIMLIGVLLCMILLDERIVMVPIFGFVMVYACGSMFSPIKYKHAALICTIILAISGLTAIFITFYTGDIKNISSYIFLLGFVVYYWTSFFLIGNKKTIF